LENFYVHNCKAVNIIEFTRTYGPQHAISIDGTNKLKVSKIGDK